MSILQRKYIWCLVILLIINTAYCRENINAIFPENIVQGEVFDIKLELFNFSGKVFDVKIDFISDGMRIAKILNEETWKSTFYYIKENDFNIIDKFKLNITEDFSGKSTVFITIKDTQDYKFNYTVYVSKNTIRDKVNVTNEITVKETNITKNPEEVIFLNSPNHIKEYKSKTQYVREYGIYAFSIFCVLIIIGIIKWKK